MKTILLLCALVVGNSNVWADVTDVINNSATSSNLGGTGTTSWADNFSITGTSGAEYYIHSMGTQNTTNALQWNKNGFLYATKSGGKLKSITVIGTNGKNLSIYAATSAYSAAPTGTALTTMSLTGSAVTYNFDENSAYGFIAIKGKDSSTSITSISIVYENGPSISANDVNIASDATSGEIAYTISNPNGSTLTAAEKSPGYDWIDNVTVVSAQNKVTFTTTENTGAAREGYITLTYGTVTKDVKITQAVGVTKYTVTIETPTNGTLIVKRAGTPIATGAQIPDGTELTIELTPASGYRMRNWQAVDATTHTYTANFTYTINAHDVTIKANFELIPEHTATFYINGTKDSEAVVKEGSAIDFPSVSIAGQKLLGWTTAAIDGTQTTKPTVLVTEATMSTADVDYYAVFGGAINAYFDASDITATPKDGSSLKWTHTATGIYISLTAGSHYTSGTPNTFTVTSGTSNYLQVTAPNNCILEKIIVTLSGSDYKINSLNPSSGTSLSTSGTTQTITFTSNMNSVQCKATSNKQIRATTIAVKALGYCTTIPTTTTPAVSSAGWATYVTPYDIEFTEGDAFAVTSVGSTVALTSVTEVPQDEPLLLKGAGTKTATILATSPAAITNKLAVSDGTQGSGEYVLANHNSKVGFYKWTGSALASGKVYLPASEVPAGTREFLGFDDEATGIANINSEAKTLFNSDFYNIAGQRIAQPNKGLYIENGKKVIIK